MKREAEMGERADPPASLDSYDDVPGQRVADAIWACAGRIMPERLCDAMERDWEFGYVTARDSSFGLLPRLEPSGLCAFSPAQPHERGGRL